jgi:hypothetical protein
VTVPTLSDGEIVESNQFPPTETLFITVRTFPGHGAWTYVLKKSHAGQDRSVTRSDSRFLFLVYLTRAAYMLVNFGIAAVVDAAGSGNRHVQLIAGVDID